MPDNKDFNNARKAKQDEFYTSLTDVEKEMKNYRADFKGKTVYCNCDDPEWSNFWLYFKKNFEFLGLKRLIATHYDTENPTYVLFKDTDGESKYPLTQNGDFRSSESMAFMQEADIICTNPPFSLFREFMAQLMAYGKKFVILGNVNAITCKEIFPLVKEGKVWFGESIHSGDREFRVPDSYPLEAAGCRIGEDGRKYIRVKGVRWFTNLDYTERHERMILFRHYTPEEYPTYSNYDAINVDKTSDIPCDYDGIMGVPITFLDKFCPDQFEILGIDKDFTTDHKRGTIDGKQKYARLFIRKK